MIENMKEIWQREGSLINKKEWGFLINSLKSEEFLTDKEEAR